jgi:hypothetical protein
MKEIPLTNYQLLAYFSPGFIVVLSFFICNEPIKDWPTLKLALKETSISLIAIALICSFLIGLITDGVRNGFVEWFFDYKERRKLQKDKINWAFFYQGKKEDVALFYARYFTYYCFDINVMLALCLSVGVLDVYSHLPHKELLTTFFGIGVLVLARDGLSLRIEMAQATNFAHPEIESNRTDISSEEEVA